MLIRCLVTAQLKCKESDQTAFLSGVMLFNQAVYHNRQDWIVLDIIGANSTLENQIFAYVKTKGADQLCMH